MTNVIISNVKHCCNRSIGVSIGMKLAGFDNVRFLDFCKIGSFSSRTIGCDLKSVNFSARLPSFLTFVSAVCFGITCKKVGWIYATRIIAFVKNVQSFWDSVSSQFKCDSVRPIFDSLNDDHSISKVISITVPSPASVFFLDKSPEPFQVFFSKHRKNAQSLGRKVRNLFAATKSMGENFDSDFFAATFRPCGFNRN